jgi:hypothetical protein
LIGGGSRLFFLGHMAWAYVWAVIFAGKNRVKLFIPAILLLAVLPDVDLFFWSYGIEHHTITHSLFFWVVLFVPLLLKYRNSVIPYFVAVLQHFVFGDFVVGVVMLFWPFSFSFFGFDYAMMSVFDVGLEVLGLFLALGIAYFDGDLRRLVSVDKRNVFMFFPFLAVVASMLFYAVDLPVVSLVSHVFVSPIYATVVFAHIILAAFLAISTFQGLRKF